MSSIWGRRSLIFLLDLTYGRQEIDNTHGAAAAAAAAAGHKAELSWIVARSMGERTEELSWVRNRIGDRDEAMAAKSAIIEEEDKTKGLVEFPCLCIGGRPAKVRGRSCGRRYVYISGQGCKTRKEGREFFVCLADTAGPLDLSRRPNSVLSLLRQGRFRVYVRCVPGPITFLAGERLKDPHPTPPDFVPYVWLHVRP